MRHKDSRTKKHRASDERPGVLAYRLGELGTAHRRLPQHGTRFPVKEHALGTDRQRDAVADADIFREDIQLVQRLPDGVHDPVVNAVIRCNGDGGADGDPKIGDIQCTVGAGFGHGGTV